MLIDKRETQLDRLINYLKVKKRTDEDEMELSDTDQDRLNRFIQMRTLELRYTKTQAIAIYERLFNKSKSQAYRDHTEMQAIFGNVQRTNKDFRRELELLRLDELAQDAKDDGDYKTAAAIRMKIFEWTTKEENEAPFDPNDIEPTTVIIGRFPEQFRNNNVPTDKDELKALISAIKSPKNLSAQAEDIDHVEIKDGE